MKLQYFRQAAPDEDDLLLADAKHHGHVPPGCLLGGEIVAAYLKVNQKPCDGCFGPRARCGGSPRIDDETEGYEAERARLAALLKPLNPES